MKSGTAFLVVFALAFLGILVGTLAAWGTRPASLSSQPSADDVIAALKGDEHDHAAAMIYVNRVLVGALLGGVAGTFAAALLVLLTREKTLS